MTERVEYAEQQRPAEARKISVRGQGPYKGPATDAKTIARHLRRQARQKDAERTIARK